MSWCPECKTEYREGFDSCSDCGCALVAELPATAPDRADGWDQEDVPAFLLFAEDDFSADSTIAWLDEAGIPVLKKYRNAGTYLKVAMGWSAFGSDLYVPSRLLARAKELVEQLPTSPDLEFPDEDTGQREAARQYDRRRRATAIVISVILYGGSAAAVLGILYLALRAALYRLF